MQLKQSLVNHLNELLPIITNEDLNIVEITCTFNGCNLFVCLENNKELKGYLSHPEKEKEDIWFLYDKFSGWQVV